MKLYLVAISVCSQYIDMLIVEYKLSLISEVTEIQMYWLCQDRKVMISFLVIWFVKGLNSTMHNVCFVQSYAPVVKNAL